MKNLSCSTLCLLFHLVLYSQNNTTRLFTIPEQVCQGAQLSILSVKAECSGTYAWDFGDGTTSSQATPVKQYNAPGVYTVTLTFTPAVGQSLISHIIVNNCQDADDPPLSLWPADPFITLYNAAGQEFDQTPILWDYDSAPPALVFDHPVFVCPQSTKLAIRDYDNLSAFDYMGDVVVANPTVAGVYTSGTPGTPVFVSITLDPVSAAATYVWTQQVTVQAPPATPTLAYDNSVNTITLDNGAALANISWLRNNVDITGLHNDTLTPGCTGMYKARVTVGACTVESAPISVNTVPPVQFAAGDISCYGAADGWLSVTPPAYFVSAFYQWNTGSVNDTIYNLQAATYTVTVTYAGYCMVTGSQTVNQPDFPIDIDAFADSNNGTILVSVSNGTPPYTYDWADLPGNNDPQNRSGLAPGTYFLTVTDAVGCTSIKTVSLLVGTEDITNDLAKITLSPNPTTGTVRIDHLADNTSITVLATDGRQLYQTWNTGASETLDLSALEPGLYVLHFRTATGGVSRKVLKQ